MKNNLEIIYINGSSLISNIVDDILNDILNDIDYQDNHEKNNFMYKIKETYELYIKYGSRSNVNVNYFHNYIKNELIKIFFEPEYSVMLEYNVNSTNSTGKKKCDIVILKYNIPYIIFPVKIIKSNYKQNKNNSWENITGELQHLIWENENIKIIPINIFMNKTPYLNVNKKITKFENITINDISIYNLLTVKNITYDIINYIMIVEHNNILNDVFDQSPNILGFDTNTPFRNMFDIVKELL
jgi:hypothetical protein